MILLCISLFTAFPCKAATVWSDDFNDGNYDEWTIMNGTFIVEDGMLKAGPGDYNFIVHPSYGPPTGTWSFDILTNSVGLDTSVTLIGTYPITYGTYPVPTPQQGLAIRSTTDSGYLFIQKVLNGTPVDFPVFFGWSSSSWQHINITRSSDGRICIFQNGTFKGDIEDASVKTTPDYFSFWSARQAIIDNIVVSDTVDIQPPPPAVPFYMQTWFLATVGAVLVAVVVIVALLMRRK